MWAEVERLAQLVSHLVTCGFIEPTEVDDAIHEVLRVAEMWGYLPPHTTNGMRSRWSDAERKRIVDAYLAFSGDAPHTPGELQAKRKSLGVSHAQLNAWATQLYGPGALSRARVTYQAEVLEVVRRVPWITVPEIRGALPHIRKVAVDNAIISAWRALKVVRRAGERGLYEYALASTPGIGGRPAG